MELRLFVLKVDDDDWLIASALLNLEGPVVHVVLNGTLRELPSNEPLGIEDCVRGIPCDLVLGSIADKALVFREGYYIGRGRVIALVVWDDFHFVVEPDSYAGACRGLCRKRSYV